MTLLRLINLLIWSVVLIYMARGAVAAVTKHARYGDPMRLACALTAIVVLGFNLRWLLLPRDVLLWQALLVLSAALAGFILRLGMTYGRGPLLHKQENNHDAR